MLTLFSLVALVALFSFVAVRALRTGDDAEVLRPAVGEGEDEFTLFVDLGTRDAHALFALYALLTLFTLFALVTLRALCASDHTEVLCRTVGIDEDKLARIVDDGVRHRGGLLLVARGEQTRSESENAHQCHNKQNFFLHTRLRLRADARHHQSIISRMCINN